MKRSFLVLVLILAGIGGAVLWTKKHGATAKPAGEKSAAEKPAGEEAEKTHVTHDENGRAVIHMDDEAQGKIGLLVAKPAAARLSPEVKGYGRVLDPSGLAALLTELASAQAAMTASSNELFRVKTLAPQGNASVRQLQTAEAAATRDQLAVQSARDRLVLAWGKGVAEQSDLTTFVQSLTSLSAVLVRIDLPAGETLKSAPTGARISSLSGNSAEAQILGAASSVDPQTQGQGFVLLVQPNALRLLPGVAMTAYLKVPGELLTGVIIPRGAVIRTEGAAWVYVRNSAAHSFTRIQILLEHPTDTGWFVSQAVTSDDNVVVTGAQTLLSEELKASIHAD